MPDLSCLVGTVFCQRHLWLQRHTSAQVSIIMAYASPSVELYTVDQALQAQDVSYKGLIMVNKVLIVITIVLY